MAFKFINPGYHKLFYSRGCKTIQSNLYNPRCGVAVCVDPNAYSANPSCSYYCENATTNLYVKFDIYLPKTTDFSLLADVIVYGQYLLRLRQDSTSYSLQPLKNESDTLTNSDTKLKLGSLNTIWLHLTTGNDWTMELNINGVDIDTEFYGVYDMSEIPNRAAIRFDIADEMPISNIFISDMPIRLKEVIMPLTGLSVETNMNESNGSYYSATVGDYVLQTVDTSGLYSICGSDSAVTGLLAVAAPAYATGDDVDYLKCRVVKVDVVGSDTVETVTDYRPENQQEVLVSLSELNDEEIADLENNLYHIPMRLPVNSDTTLASLNGLKIGWVNASRR